MMNAQPTPPSGGDPQQAGVGSHGLASARGGSGAPPPHGAREALIAGIGLLAAALLFCAPALDPAKVFIAGDILLAHPPFLAAQEKSAEVHNPFLSDQTAIFYPWLWWAREKVRSGEFPLWTPESYEGAPFFGNLSTGLLFPLTWLYFLLPFGLSFAVVAIIKLWLAGFFLYLFLRMHGVSRAAALAGALAYQFAGYNVVWLNYALSHVAVLAPLLLWLAERWYRKPTARRAILVSLGLAASFLAGHPETTLTVGLVVGAYLACRTWHAWREGVRRAGLALVGITLLALGLVAIQLLPFAEYLWHSEGRRLRELHVDLAGGADRLISGPGLLLFVMGGVALIVGVRGLRRLRGLSLATIVLAGGALAVTARLALVLGANPAAALLALPHLYGDPTSPAGYSGPHTFNDVSGGFIGVLGLTCALTAVLLPARSFVHAFFRWSWLIAFGVAFRVPGPYQLARHLPGLGYVAETRTLAAVALCGAVLVAVGIDRLSVFLAAARERGALLGRVALAGLSAGAVFVACGLVPWDSLWADAKPARRDEGIVSPRQGAVHGERTPLDVLVRVDQATERVRITLDGQIIAILERPADVERGHWEAGVPVLLAARADDGVYRLGAEALGPSGAHHGLGTRTFRIARPRKLDARDLAVLLAAIGLLAVWLAGPMGRRRVLAGLAPVLVFAELMAFGAGYNPVTPAAKVFPKSRVTDFLAERTRREGPFRVLPEGTVLQPNTHYVYGFEHLRGYDCMEPRSTMRFLRFLARDGEVSWRDWNRRTIDYASPLFDLLGVRYVVSAEDLDDVPGFERALHAEGLGVYRNIEACPRVLVMDRAVRVMGNDLAALARLDPRRTAFLEVEPPELGGRGRAELISYGDHRIDVNVQVDGAAILVLTDTFYPGWTVTVDGHPRVLLRTHGAFRAVVVKPGDRQVEFRYRPWSVLIGGGLSALSAALALVILLAGSRFGTVMGRGRNPCATHPPHLEST